MTYASARQLADAVRTRDAAAIARALTIVENQLQGCAELLAALRQPPEAAPAGAQRVGITGAPGAGKSSFIGALLAELVPQGKNIAVLAIDPSSPLSGGAVLGDRLRFGPAAASDHVFVRSMAARTSLGGLNAAINDALRVLDAAGFDLILIETVGAGQSEVEIMRVAQTVLVLCPPGLGDEIQALKAGILEIAHILVVSKGDLPAAATLARDLADSLKLRRKTAWPVPVLTVSSLQRQGIAEVAQSMARHHDFIRQAA
ncbi:MAG: methylmalonyl Co-A mutase-associated GTPase MeaB [Betaproteobacteria bacterium]|nr:methylmalonyl Co-A mutase-associated GTPase MeaB [Betaproteobacteria bacterium]